MDVVCDPYLDERVKDAVEQLTSKRKYRPKSIKAVRGTYFYLILLLTTFYFVDLSPFI